jgi:hypothetical protein
VAKANPEALFVDGHDDAIMGVADRYGMPTVAAYDYVKVIRRLMRRDGMSWEEAVEYFDFNLIGGWVGDETPVFIQRLPAKSVL